MTAGRTVSKRARARSERLGPRRRGRILVGLLCASGLALGCVANQIRVDARNPKALGDTASFSVSLAPTTEGATPATSEALATALLDRVEETLAAKGYEVEWLTESDLLLELSLRKERVSRKTYSSDPDASGARMVERTEAILTLRAVDHRRGVEIWRCDARGLLPEPDLAFVESETDLWNRLLERALAEVPSRR